MLKVMALLRTVFLVFIIVFTIRSMPFNIDVPQTHDEQYARVAAATSQLSRACWYAVGWIAFETAVGWWLAMRRPRGAAAAHGPVRPETKPPPAPGMQR